MTWEELRKLFLKELLKFEKELSGSTLEFSEKFLKELKKKGFQLDFELEEKLRKFAEEKGKEIFELLKRCASTVAVRVAKEMRDEFVSEVAKEVFHRRWADGKNLSERIWWITEEIKEGMKRVLAQGVRLGHAIDRMVYEMQYTIEREVGGRFTHVTTDKLPGWIDELWEEGVRVIRDPTSRKRWEKVLEKVEAHINELERRGTYYASKKLLRDVEKAVREGAEELITQAVNRWLYERQLYYLKRVARTEAANAFHLAQIRATERDPEVIGYQWRLSRTHPKPDICDWYASVELGLGKGVWPKDRVPRTKPHPHCLCYLVPRVTPEKRRGAVSFKEFWERLPEAKKKEVLPKWASKLAYAGVDPNEFLKEGEIVKKEEFLRKLGEDKFKALSAIGAALEEVKWRDLKGHLERRKEYVKNARELNARFEAILKDTETRFYGIKHVKRGFVRLYGIKKDGTEVAIFDHDGTRASWFPLDKVKEEEFIKKMEERTGGSQNFVYIGIRKELWGGK